MILLLGFKSYTYRYWKHCKMQIFHPKKLTNKLKLKCMWVLIENSN